MEENEIVKIATEANNRSKSNERRLDRVEGLVSEIRAVSETLIKLTMEMKHTNETVQEIKDKVCKLEAKPGRLWNESVKAILTAVMAAVGAALAGGIFYILAHL